jgi:hypothetical protein
VGELRQFLRGIRIPLALAVVLVVVIAIVLPRMGEPEPERGISAQEQPWLAAYSDWTAEFRGAVTRANLVRSSLAADLPPLLEQVEQCGEALQERVGPPPSARFEAIVAASGQACALATGAADAFRRNDSTPNLETTNLLKAAVQTFFQADFRLRKLLVLERPLPRVQRLSTESRIENRLGAAASYEHGFVEVRCWAASEWPSVRQELDAVGLEDDETLAEVANANRWLVHLSPQVCDPLAQLAYGQSSASGDQRRRLAAALLVLAHESAHVAGIAPEREVARAAAGAVEGLARLLGAEPDDAASLAALARELGDAPVHVTLDP